MAESGESGRQLCALKSDMQLYYKLGGRKRTFDTSDHKQVSLSFPCFSVGG